MGGISSRRASASVFSYMSKATCDGPTDNARLIRFQLHSFNALLTCAGIQYLPDASPSSVEAQAANPPVGGRFASGGSARSIVSQIVSRRPWYYSESCSSLVPRITKGQSQR